MTRGQRRILAFGWFLFGSMFLLLITEGGRKLHGLLSWDSPDLGLLMFPLAFFIASLYVLFGESD
jgi:hypothetical protein